MEKLLMPERDLSATIKRLTPLLTQPDLEKKLDAATGNVVINKPKRESNNEEELIDDDMKENEMNEKQLRENKKAGKDTDNMLAQVVGIIIGSPEFQRK